MANVLTTIVAWETFQALATILIFIVLSKILTKWTKNDSDKKKQIKKGFTILIILIIVFTILSGFYRVSNYENVLLTKLSGRKIIIENTGIKYSFLGTVQKIDLREQIMAFPSSNQFEDSDTILTKDGIPIRISAIFIYKITNSKEWALKIKNPEQQLFYKINSIIIETIKQKDYQYIMTNRVQIENEIFNKIEQKGIEKLSIKFIKTADSMGVTNAKTEAEANKIKTESMITQAKSEAQSYQILQNSLKNYSP